LAKTERSVLRVEDLSVSYGELNAIRQVSLEVNEGEFVALLGANGSGKSTLIAAVLGVVRAKKGSIWFLDRDITRKATDYIVGSGISVVPEGRGIMPLMTVMENLQLGAYHVKGDISQRLNWVFERFPILAERKNMAAGMLSGGQQQMLDIGRALMGGPKLIVMDEPSLGLAPSVVSELFNILLDLKKEGQTILLAEQNARKALQCADRAYIFEVGSIVFEGTVQELARDSRLQQAYLGKV
jgi:branched-chain amino acid transport system ATP-binding protein